LTKKIQSIARHVHMLLGCRGVTRSDFMIDRRGRPYFLEINTIPGMTQTSLVPQAARQAGLTFPQLLDRLIELAMADLARSGLRVLRLSPPECAPHLDRPKPACYRIADGDKTRLLSGPGR